MTTTMQRIAPAGLLAATLVLTGCGSSMSDHDMGSMASPTVADTSATSSSPAPAGASATPASGRHNDADVTFVTGMIPHHGQAVEMSTTLLAKSGIDPDVTALANQIKRAQGPEITQMSGWLAGWGEPGPATTHHGDVEGMMSHADMAALENADGAQAARLFLKGMIEHHKGAVAMATTELSKGANPDAKKLAEQIRSSQQAEIARMQQLLRG